jgi:hypothetical protein
LKKPASKTFRFRINLLHELIQFQWNGETKYRNNLDKTIELRKIISPIRIYNVGRVALFLDFETLLVAKSVTRLLEISGNWTSFQHGSLHKELTQVIQHAGCIIAPLPYSLTEKPLSPNAGLGEIA